MNIRTRERQELASAKRIVKGLSDREFEEVRIVLGLSRSKEELLQSGPSQRLSARAVKKK
jgi:hypothetical protein